MTDWRWRRLVAVAGDTSPGHGIGWEVTNFREGVAWTVHREDGGEFPVFASTRGSAELPSFDVLENMTRLAVADLLTGADLTDHVGWITRNISAALMLAAGVVTSWEGDEWAVETASGEVAVGWAQPGDGRVPFKWLRATGVDRDFVVGNYQDDGVFGLSFIGSFIGQKERILMESAVGILRPRRDLPFVTGAITAVEVAYDTVVIGGFSPGLVTEALLHGEGGSLLLIAAEADGRDTWILFDEAVVALAGLSAADRLAWFPERRTWRSTRGARPSSPARDS
jgi:hypothetical protein